MKKHFLWLFLILGIAAVVIGSIFHFKYPNREQTISKDVLYISPQMKDKISYAVQGTDNILGIQVVTIKFKSNIRIETYMNISSDILQDMYNRFVNNKVVETPVFNENKVNNDRILRLIEGEFVCVPFNQSTAYRYVPQAGSLVGHVCAIGIPPYKYGEFNGILTLYLKEAPVGTEKTELFFFAREVSNIIYSENKIYENKK